MQSRSKLVAYSMYAAFAAFGAFASYLIIIVINEKETTKGPPPFTRTVGHDIQSDGGGNVTGLKLELSILSGEPKNTVVFDAGTNLVVEFRGTDADGNAFTRTAEYGEAKFREALKIAHGGINATTKLKDFALDEIAPPAAGGPIKRSWLEEVRVLIKVKAKVNGGASEVIEDYKSVIDVEC